MHPNAALLHEFYSSFQRRDASGMAACYHANAEFSDEVFKNLKGPEVAAMWQMLCERATDLTITFDAIEANDRAGSANWEARYSFSKTRRSVHNRIRARFEFEDGRILRHRDEFDLWRWAAMALGPKGLLLGWLPAMQRAIQQEARSSLDAFTRAS